jgi:hypothetical protein
VRPPPVLGAQVIDGAGAFLMPAWSRRIPISPGTDQPTLDAIQRMPPEEHILWCAQVAETLPRHGLDILRRRGRRPSRGSDVVIRNAIEDGTIVGPRYLAASQEITVPAVSATPPSRTCRSRSSPSARSSPAPRRCAAACACS